MSAIQQPSGGNTDPGQLILKFLLPALVLAPFVMTVLVRGTWVPDCRNRAAAANAMESFSKQHLWPFERAYVFRRLPLFICAGEVFAATGFNLKATLGL